ncbi:ParB/RepB/Spo0J family partition protein [Spartinivicinus ruber]|uniref:ParB/RepB/Spo0J family partition protein n=1 Tax=Spartinivicinus ruber TaxID=2683272 RepID=UPI0013D70984|nr:ParB/RepB/Spo0J family partition protein [Spartinivicinus ruber]
MATKKRGLGRGLDALLGSTTTATAVVETNEEQNNQLEELPVEWIQRGRYQPRRDMHPEALEELSNSIKAQGVMQPIVVRPIGQNKYEIIAGERRWRATQLAGLDKIPAVIREVPDEAAIAMALIENIQREDLNPIEEAMALHRLQQEFGLTQQQVADAVGKSRATITNLLRLMTLADDVKTMLEHGDLEMGHARAILSLTKTQQLMAAKTIVAKGLSVRQTEALVRRMQAEAENNKPEQKIDPDIKQLEDELGEKLGTEVFIQHSAKGKGKLVIKYNNLDELDGVLAHIK